MTPEDVWTWPCCGKRDVPYDSDRVAALLARCERMLNESGIPERIIWSPDIEHQRTDGERIQQVEGLHKVQTTCDPTLPPNSIVFVRDDLATAEAPAA